jgi:hypothetical protein
VTDASSLFLVELVPFAEANEESTATRRRRQRIAAESALAAIHSFIVRDGGRLLSATASGPDRATGLFESVDDGRSVYRIFAFPV